MSDSKNRFHRREMLRRMGGGALGAALGWGLLSSAEIKAARESGSQEESTGKGPYGRTAPEAKIGLIKGNDRRDIVYESLKKIEDEILASIGGKKKILIKPNFVGIDRELCATHVDAVRAILDFLKPHCKQEIIVGESTASPKGTFEGFKNYGYLPLEKEYGIKLVDLNKTPWEYRYVFGKGHKPVPIRVISTFFDPDLYIISAAKMKTHDRALTTLSLKNILLAAPLNDYTNNDKWKTHMDYHYLRESLVHFNMFHLAQEIYPALSIIDGFTAMEGDGPYAGTPVDARLAVAGTDALAVDMLTTKLMGFDPSQIMYLTALAEAGMGQGDFSKMKILGTPAEECQYQFKPSKHMVEAYGLG